ncbi:MAG TPA: DUF6193 family natural product biosynthesis protein [Planctomycetota bacterium]|nr:DUF6193 family natural product biosynthesis protein [Planctomycetota bacterium]
MDTKIAWDELLKRFQSDPHLSPLVPFAQLAAQDEVLKTLYPVTSLDALGFSIVQSYPVKGDFPCVTAKDQTFYVWSKNFQPLGSGSLDEAFSIVKSRIEQSAEFKQPASSR